MRTTGPWGVLDLRYWVHMEWISIFVLAAVVLLNVAMRKASARKRTRELADIDATFKSLAFHSPLPGQTVDIENSIVVSEFIDEPGAEGRRSAGHPLIIHRIYKNSAGEYFLAISGTPPYFTQLSRERAKNALRRDAAAYEREFGQTT